MLKLVPVLLALVAQQPEKPVVPPEDDDEVVRGFPEGDVPPLPERVNWELTKVVARSATRERIDLAGLWRFEAVAERESPVLRSDMGWIEMPRPVTDDGTTVFDRRFRAAEGLWRGKPLEQFAYVWAERDITITQGETLKWLNRRIYLVLRGVWADAEIYTSQRLPKRVIEKDNPATPTETHVHVEPVTGVDRDGFRWFDITEQLIYPGTTQLTMRLKLQRSDQVASPSVQSGESYVGLELKPSGPRIESISLRRDAERGEIEARFDLVRPKGYMVFPAPPIRTIPMTLRVRLDDLDTDEVLQKLDHDIGPITDNERTETVRILLPRTDDQAVPARLRLRARLTQTVGGTFDEVFPLEFQPDQLAPVE